MLARKLIVTPIALLVLSVWSFSSFAEDIVRVEEDWELHVLKPNQLLDAPQVTVAMLPFGHVGDEVLGHGGGVHFHLDINYGLDPNFENGGFHLCLCDGEDDFLVNSMRLFSGIRLSHESEWVKWTQVVEKTATGFKFYLKNGTSTTWGNFGGPTTELSLSAGDAGETDLNHYEYDESLEHSGVTYAGNRCAVLKLKTVRKVEDDGDVITLSPNIDINSY